ncbi:MAG TPA: dihydroorotate dehydrogenase electron transfer subunit [Clostridiaceae bacterium]|nr:dihydroorotate dehydrogenase electron transfer subunit [Clostridiaceae bacterium]
MSKLLKEKIIKIEKLAPLLFRLTIQSEYIAKNAKPGQFVNIKCCDGIDALLRRPISICSVNREQGLFDIVFEVRGRGTEILSLKKPGDILDILGPLGKSFYAPKDNSKIAIVGGGIGVFPLLFLLKELRCAHKTAFLGFRSAENAVLLDEFKKESDSMYVTTDDGSLGSKGFVTDILEQKLSEESYDIIYSCGPVVMMKRVAEAAQKHEIKCQVSLEERMGCGIGACLVCVCKTRKDDGWEYSHICSDGTVFWSSEVIFD